MRHFYYIKKSGKEYAYQDEEVKRDGAQKLAYEAKLISKEPIVVTKEQLATEISTHKLEYVKVETDSKTEQETITKEEVLASEADVTIRWDGRSPYYELVSGVAPEAIPFLGWPQVSKENYVEPTEEPVKDVEEKVEEAIDIVTPEDTIEVK
jgi:hypothetical protein